MRKIKRYDGLENAPEGYYICDQAPEVFSVWYTGPYKDHCEANHARLKREEEIHNNFIKSKMMSTSCPM